MILFLMFMNFWRYYIVFLTFFNLYIILSALLKFLKWFVSLFSPITFKLPKTAFTERYISGMSFLSGSSKSDGILLMLSTSSRNII